MVNFGEKIRLMEAGLYREKIMLGTAEAKLLELDALRKRKLEIKIDSPWQQKLVDDLKREKIVLDELISLFEKLKRIQNPGRKT